ncbi:acyltransferase family protein [Neorhizobium galegae]|uniref:Putative acetyltransferase n=2 Tax=Neorhizobium galegae TaxID=399 RepID=A0A068SSR5_NEOGA|nr:acyltransferase [Neorhizobium galegae]CDN49337.1 Putative acetyltransferase [Neorhizobium galegae bv. orientalis str. HAMBI 540]CDZ47349.1 Acyltransferase 3 [Neorhizobium galegae bv. orientalis]
MAVGEIRSMTGIRGAAAVFVMVYHFELDRVPSDGAFSTFLNHGYLSVDLFFILSGFVMAHVYGPSFLSGAFRFGDFLWHRIARVYPLYLVVTLAFIALAFLKSSELDIGPDVFISNVLMLQSLGNWPSIDPPAWSVSAEMLVYLLFPVIGLLCLKSSRMAALLLGIGAILAILILTLAASLHYIGSTISKGLLDLIAAPFTLIRCLAGFTLGQLVWRLHNDPAVAAFAARTPVQIGVGLLAVVALTQPDWDFAIYLLIISLLFCLSTDRGLFADFFASPPMHFLGDISFAVYLTHYRALGVWAMVEGRLGNAGFVLRNVVATVVTSMVVIGVSWLLHVAIERPCRQLMRKGSPAMVRKRAA